MLHPCSLLGCSLLPVAVLAASTLSAAPAEARVIDHARFNEVFSIPVPDVCGVRAIHSRDVVVTFKINLRGGLVYFADHVRGTEAFTNVESGRTMTTVFTTHVHDLVVTDNGDGTLTVRVHRTRNFTILDDEGNRVGQDTGTMMSELLVDHGGTPSDPVDDTILSTQRVVKESTGLNEIGATFCEDFLAITG